MLCITQVGRLGENPHEGRVSELGAVALHRDEGLQYLQILAASLTVSDFGISNQLSFLPCRLKMKISL